MNSGLCLFVCMFKTRFYRPGITATNTQKREPVKCTEGAAGKDAKILKGKIKGWRKE